MEKLKLSSGDVIKYSVERRSLMFLQKDVVVAIEFPDGKRVIGRFLDKININGSTLNIREDFTDRDLVMMGLGSYLSNKKELNNE